MNLLADAQERDTHSVVRDVLGYIRRCQRDDGGILWFEDGKLDPWDHTEAAMALTIGGNFQGFQRAFEWLRANQNTDGSWFAMYYGPSDTPEKERAKIETNFVAYPACGLWHYYLVTQDRDFVTATFPMVAHAIDFVLAQQNPEGDVQWALSRQEDLPNDALITACASILRSLECAIALAEVVGDVREDWRQSYQRLADALLTKPWRFDRTWEAKTRFSMDWFYPILAGIYDTHSARQRIDARWLTFVHSDFGCRCVSDEPWVTVAESCELTLALVACQRREQARALFQRLLRWQDSDGGFWTGYSFRDEVIWPHEKTTWTAAAVLLALDALEGLTPASQLFTEKSRLLFP